ASAACSPAARGGTRAGQAPLLGGHISKGILHAFQRGFYLDNVTLNEWSAGPSETVLLYVPGGGSLILNDGGEELYRAILRVACGQDPNAPTTVWRMLPWHFTPRGPWKRASLGLDCGDLSDMGGNSRRRTRRPRLMRAVSQRCMLPNAGDCRLKQLRTWATVSISSGGAFVVVLRPVHATPASTPTTICVPS